MPIELTIASAEKNDDGVQVNLSDGSSLLLTLDQLTRMGVPRVILPPGNNLEQGLRDAIKRARPNPDKTDA